MKKILIKSIPYVLSILWGGILAIVSIYFVQDQEVSDLLNNIAASLLAIPIVFLVYNYSEYKTSSKLNKTLTKNLVFEINSQMLKILMVFRRVLVVRGPLTWDSIQKLLNQHARDLKLKLKITKQDADELKTYKEEINELIFKSAKTSLLYNEQVLILSELVKAVSHVINEQKYGANKIVLSKYIEHVLSLIDDWFMTCDTTDLQSHEHFRAAMERGVKQMAAK